MTQGEAQQLFVELEAKWVAWCLEQPGWKLRHGEGRILQLGPDGKRGRKARLIRDGADAGLCWVKDAVHLSGGAHYMGTGADWQLFVNGVWITNTDAPEWQAAGAKWKSLHPLARWGGDFGRPDGNHISVFFNGKA